MGTDDDWLLALCEETRMRVLRGDGIIGCLPVAEVEQMVSTYHALGARGVAAAWTGLARYHADLNGLHVSPESAARCAGEAVLLGSAEALGLLSQAVIALRSAGIPDPPNAGAVHDALAARLDEDPDGRITFTLGLLTCHGYGCAQDLAACVALHERAAARGCADAMFELYVLYATGQGTAPDDSVARAWCQRAAALGQARACYNLGSFYASGSGVPRDEATAQAWYRRASEAGNGRATAMLAYMVQRGEGSPPDPQGAEALFALAEAQGFDVEGFREEFGV